MKDREFAVAIGFEPEEHDAPKVLAAGFGEIARSIMASAREHGVHIHEDTILARVPTGGSIPDEAYQLAAELLTFLDSTDAAMAAKTSGDGR